MHLIHNNYQVFIGKLGDKEIDFVAEKNNERIYIQVAYIIHDDTIAQREFGNLATIPDNYPKYVVTMDELQIPHTYKGIKQIHLRDFLLMSI